MRESGFASLWEKNIPEKFWLCRSEIDHRLWQSAVENSVALLGLPVSSKDQADIMALSLGEARFGDQHWHLSKVKRAYYFLKPVLPRFFTRLLRQFYNGGGRPGEHDYWPIDQRFADFQFEVLRQLMLIGGQSSLELSAFWPEKTFAFVLTHDIETARGQSFVREVAALEETWGFRSSFNFVLDRYPLDFNLMGELRERGFEVGCHGWKHDGKLFNSEEVFMARAKKINQKIKEYEMSGFRAPLTHRNPVWMQALDIEYDASFFDTDPFEPIPGGSMSIWPFFLGRFVELPYTLVQDYTLASILGEKTPRVWLEKVEFIRKYRGMALLNSHPDYLLSPDTFNVYAEFLKTMNQAGDFWHALPREVARWWKFRAGSLANTNYQSTWMRAAIQNNQLTIL